jgi:hypothetical protein
LRSAGKRGDVITGNGEISTEELFLHRLRDAQIMLGSARHTASPRRAGVVHLIKRMLTKALRIRLHFADNFAYFS